MRKSASKRCPLDCDTFLGLCYLKIYLFLCLLSQALFWRSERAPGNGDCNMLPKGAFANYEYANPQRRVKISQPQKEKKWGRVFPKKPFHAVHIERSSWSSRCRVISAETNTRNGARRTRKPAEEQQEPIERDKGSEGWLIYMQRPHSAEQFLIQLQHFTYTHIY